MLSSSPCQACVGAAALPGVPDPAQALDEDGVVRVGAGIVQQDGEALEVGAGTQVEALADRVVLGTAVGEPGALELEDRGVDRGQLPLRVIRLGSRLCGVPVVPFPERTEAPASQVG
jgi:hypothetical protein